ncbi:TetR/AcrR family transcriptional regulator [Neobacillus sp. OS1-2]|uniref:TetR/AcrR family transcriptional regulator n=1 Tax=Neobacillus sp. OS1-2 TaxID=3070680 RepID=UPI0027E0ED5A|nr:TetR/AcrR family transcriptional regulator [Neobacillus sp. OS1-2]WML41742.1 TetR/AcrR family transcriptional regulator [Neobacillus sp. OS1-2]
MYSKFLNLEQEKQDRIINAAIKEFAQKGYERASTNEMVKAAGISKGLLFHYFGNKKQLFLFLFDYCCRILAEQFYQKINLAERDFFTRIRQAVMIKMELLTTYPDLFTFIEEAYLEDSAEVKVEVDKKVKVLSDANFGKVYEGIDFSKFRDDMDIKKVLKIITYTFEKLSEEMLSQAKLSPTHHIDYEKGFQEAEVYFEIFTTCFYK